MDDDNKESKLLEFFGTECSHCVRMAPLVERLEKELGVSIDKQEVWHDKASARRMMQFDKGLCGGVPFFFNTKSGEYICGEAPYEVLKEWASKG